MFKKDIADKFSVSNLLQGALSGLVEKSKETVEKKQIFSNFLRATDPN
jgi:hypothetical protein